jgi:hypothetical protein
MVPIASQRYALGGVYLELMAHDPSTMRINAVATDGRRLDLESLMIRAPELPKSMAG